MIKSERTTSLAESGIFDASTTARLAALSVTSVEELHGIMNTHPEAMSKFLGGLDIQELQGELARVALQPAGAGAEGEEVPIAYGATVPDDLDLPKKIDERYFEEEILPAAMAIEPVTDEGIKVDVRSCMGPVRFQGLRPTCVAHAACALIECLRSRQHGTAVDLSEQFSYWSAKQAEGNQRDGTFVRVALDCANASGICNETSWPYDAQIIAGNQGQGPPPNPAITEAAAQRVSARKDLPEQGSEAIRKELDGGNPVALSIQMYENWNRNPAIWNYGSVPLPPPEAKPLDIGHAMCAVGYALDNEFAGRGYLILRNSWGEQFAAQSLIDAPGHALLPFLYFDKFGGERFGATL